MARKAKPTASASTPAAKAEPQDESEKILFFMWKRRFKAALAKKKEADAFLKNECKKARADLGDDAVTDIKESIKLEKEGGEAVFRATIERMLRIARWMGLGPGVQGDLFAHGPSAGEKPSPYDLGKVAGMNGDPQDCPFHEGTEEGQDWLRGYNEGQSAIFNIQRAKDAEEAFPDEDEGETDPEAGEDDSEGDDADSGVVPPPIGDQPATAQVAH